MSKSTGIVLATLAVGAMVFLCLAQGCSLRDLINVDVPRDVQVRTGAPPRVPLSRAEELSAEYGRAIEREAKDRAAAGAVAGKKFQRELADCVERGDEEARKLEADFAEFRARAEAANSRWLASVQRGEDVAGWIGAALNTGLNQLSGSGVAAVPGGLLAVGLLTGAAGLFLPKPGTASAMQKAEKAAEDRGYQMGQQETLATINAAPTPTPNPAHKVAIHGGVTG